MLKYYDTDGKIFRNRALVRMWKYRKEAMYQLGIGLHNYSVMAVRSVMFDEEKQETADIVDNILSLAEIGESVEHLALQLVEQDPVFASAFAHYLSFYLQDMDEDNE